ncbi:PKD repeat-containing protein [Zobellia uliginosa]|uniref:PKD repeat-containing protein n=1 Tax=Zobellia uliginosa TaxID=143224 RepID=A0ABY1KVD6_9FLAO|nr:PKD domain-containing protein [Zobellia uliginosa]SIS82960.1 PKD repeat-containing protein [Zobellia uliginosa]
MKKITLLTVLVLLTTFTFGQTPCAPISTLNCAEIASELPLNLSFDGSDTGILNSGFTMVDPPSSRLAADDLGADPNVPGLLSDHISISGGSLNVTATKGINYSQLSGSPNSTLTNSQVNALGTGFSIGSDVIEVSATIDQPDFTGTAGNNSQQAGIWLGLNEDNYVKLVVVKSSATEQKIQMLLEQTNPANSANLILSEFNTSVFEASTVASIGFKLVVDPSDNSVRGYYSLDGGEMLQVTGAADFMTTPTSFFTGVDHDNDGASAALTYAGIMTSTRRATSGNMVVSYKDFSIEEIVLANSETDILTFVLLDETGDALIDTEAHTINIEVGSTTDLTALAPQITLSSGANSTPASGVPVDFSNGPVSYIVTAEDGATTQDWSVIVVKEELPFEAHINFQDNPSETIPPAGYLADYGKAFGNAAVDLNGNSYGYGWKLAASGNPYDASEEVAGNSTGVGRMRLGNISNYNAAPLQEKLEGTLVHFQGDNISGWGNTQARKNELFWEMEIPNGVYEVTIGLGDKAEGNTDSRHSATVEGYSIISAFAPAEQEVRISTMVVQVSDGLLTVDGTGGFNSKITHIDVVETTASPVNGILAFTPATADQTLETGASTSFVAELAGTGAVDIGLAINDNVDETTTNGWLTLPEKSDIGSYEFTMDGTSLVVGDARSAQVIATAKGFVPAVLDIDLTVTSVVPLSFSFVDDFDAYALGNLHEVAPTQWLKEKPADVGIPVLGEGITPNTTQSLDFSNGAHTHDLIPLTEAPITLEADQPFYFSTYFKVGSVSNRVRTAILIADDVPGDQWVREQVASDGNSGLIARIGLGGPGSDNGNLPVDSDKTFQFVVKGEWDGAGTINYSWTIEPKLDLSQTVWTSAGSHTVEGTPKIDRLFISSVGTNDAKIGGIRLASDYSVVVTEELNTAPLIEDQEFSIAEDAPVGTSIATVVASDSDPLTYAITAGNDNGTFAIDPNNGELTTLIPLDAETVAQYVLTVEVGDGTNTVSAQITVNIDDVVEASPCSPLSSLPCDQLEASLPLSLDFTIANGKLSDSGFTMVLEPSARLVSDDGLADENITGYAPSLVGRDASGLSITSTKGIFYSQLPAQGAPNSTETNSQMNALGLGLPVPSTVFSVSATLENPDFSVSAGNNSQQAGIWYGLDEDHIVKLAVAKTGNTTRKVQLHLENMDGTSSQTAYFELNTGSLASNTGDIKLRMEFDPVNNTVSGYYSLDGGTEVLVSQGGTNSLSVPASYFSGSTYDTENQAQLLNFAGIFTTHRRADVDQSITALFKDFAVEGEPEPLVLSFDINELNFSGEQGSDIATQSVSVSASSGNPTFVLSDDPDAASWLILPTDPVLGEIEFEVRSDIPVGTYGTTVFASDQPDLGYANAEMTINLEITEAVNDFAVNINFSDQATAAPAGYEKDGGDAYADRGNGFSYGWLDATTSQPADLTKNGRNRVVSGVSELNNTLIHMQYGDVSSNASNGYLADAKWEIEVPNGDYLVTVFVGDPDVDTPASNTPAHRINAEGVTLVNDYVPTGTAGASSRFTSESAIVNVSDNRLTLDPLGGSGKNTKINSVQIVATSVGIQTPKVVGITPPDGATGVSVSTSVSANNLFLPNSDTNGNAGVDNTTITNATVRLFKQGSTTPIGASVNGTGGGDAINLVPNLPLEANTVYVFEIDGVLDLVGEPFEFFTSSFTTGDGNAGPVTDLDNVSFTNAGVVGSNGKYSTLTIGPDDKLYGLEISGDIHRWNIDTDGTLTDEEVLTAWKTAYGGSRTSVGLVFDPAATSSNLIAYVSHDSGGLNSAPDWDGKISKLTGANLENEQLLVTDLPRSTKDHLTNSLTFRPGEPNVIYFNQGSNSAAGKPDNSWGNREESLLTAATLRLDLSLLPATLPLNVRTTRDAMAINNVDVNSPTLDGLYNPYYVNAPLKLFATGIRNAYDLVWHSNGQLYVPANGTAGGSNAPASIDGTRRPDGSFYDHSNPLYPVVPFSNGNNVQRDWLFRINPNTTMGYYGHPNPFRGEFALNRGDIDVSKSAYDGVQPDENYRGAAFDFEFNKSPNGVIEYRSNAENGNLKGALLVVRYSGGSDIIALVPDGPGGDISTFKEGIPGFTGFQDPLDLVEDTSNGNIYVSDYGRSQIVLLKPSNQASPTPLIVLDTEKVTGDAISNSGSFTSEILLSNLGNASLMDVQAQISGADQDQFSIVGLPTSINAQNSASFQVVFTPTSNGPKSAELTLTGTNAEPVVVSLNGLGKTGLGGNNEPSLQWILDTHLGDGAVNVGDTDPTTNLINLPNGSGYNDILGDEVAVQKFERAVDAPVTVELLSLYGPTNTTPVVAFGWYVSGDANTTSELFTVSNSPASNGQTLNAPIVGATEFDPGAVSFGFYSRWPFFGDRHLFSEDALNTFADAIPHHVRVYELPGEENAYIIATEEHVSGFDYQDIVVIVRNIKPFDDAPSLACSPISILECDELEVNLPFSLNFDGTEGGLANTGFTMVDNPSARLAVDGTPYNLNVPGYEPGRISLSNGNLVLNAANGIAYLRNGPGAGTSTDVNSQINTLGVAVDADSYGSFSIETSLVNPYSDGSNNSEQAGLWFGLDEDNYVKLVASNGNRVELLAEVAGLSATSQSIKADDITDLHSSNVGLRLFVDIENNLLVGYYSLNGGAEVEVGSLPLPSGFVAGNSSYDDLSFAGIFNTKRREATANVNHTFELFRIVSDDVVAFEPVKINFSLPEDVPPSGYLVDSGLAYADRGNGYSYGWLATDGTTGLDLSERARNRGVAGVDILQNTLIHMQYQNVKPEGQEGIWEMEIPNGNYTVAVGVGDPNVDGQAGTEPFHTINIEGVNAINRYSPTGVEGASTRFTSGVADVTVTDGRLTIDASGGFNTKLNSLEITQGSGVVQPYFANVNPADNANDVRIEDFQINVEVIVPDDYEIDNNTLAGNINLFEVTAGGDVVVPSNSNDTGGGDAITLTPIQELKEFTTYRFVLTSDIEANRRGDLNDRIPFRAFESTFETGELDDGTIPIRDLTGVEFIKVSGVANLGPGVDNQRFSSLVIGPDGKLYASTIGNFNSDGQIYRWDMAIDGTLSNLEILSPPLQGSPHPETGARGNDDRLIIGLAFDPASTADNLIAYVTHSKASISGGPEWDGKLSRLTGPDLSTVEDLVIHLPRSVNDHLTNSIAFDAQGDLYISQGSNSAGGSPDGNWGNRPERLLAAAILKLELDKLPNSLPLSVYTTDDISVINAAPNGSLQMSDATYNPYATNSPLTIFASGIRNAYDLVWHSNGWLYVPTNGTAGNNNSSPNSPSTSDYPLARRIDGLSTIPNAPKLLGGETQKDWLFKTKGGSYHGHPNPYRGEFILNHGGISYSGLPGQVEASYTDVGKYPDDLAPDPNYREPAFDFGKNKSPNGAIEYKSDAFEGKLQGLLMVVRFSGQDDLLVLDPKSSGDIAEAYSSIPGLSGFDDPLDVVEDPTTGNIYISEYDRDNNGTARLTLLRAATPASMGPSIVATPDELIFEATTNNEGSNTDTKTVEISNDGNAVLHISSASLTGTFASQFSAVQPSGSVTLNPGESQIYTLTYTPSLDGTDLGYQDAVLTLESDDTDTPSLEIGLHALKKSGFEGGQEPALQDVVDALGIGISVGWTSLSSSTDPAPVGDEVEVERWVKASEQPVKVTPVGRYSPREELPFGWYTNDGTVVTHEVGVLADDIANAQTLFPPIASGTDTFDPQGAVFGFYVESQSFGRFNYTEDAINTGGVAHRVRIYPVNDREGNAVENSYLIAFEDASNGDYQDYMFIIDNVIPFESGILALDFDKEDMGFFTSIKQENVPLQSLTLNGNGGITSSEINLQSTEEWVVLPDTFEMGTAFEVGVDVSGLPIGSYVATISASAANYESDAVSIALEITNELVYTYQFNFQDPDELEVSPEGYIDDVGAPYGVQNTVLGDLNYGWVIPGTLTPADAAANARNRNTGANDDALVKTFSIIGHRSANTYPLRDWIVEVPNGIYSVNIGVAGDPDYADSNHVLEVNGVVVVDYDQESIVPENFDSFQNTERVEVTDGLLRLSLAPAGDNAKVSYIRLAPIDSSLLPPTILATFNGNERAPDVFRGAVNIALEATDESGSGGIAFIEYVLDGAPVESYTDAFDIADEGDHILVVTAEDNNGNSFAKTYNFTIETPTGALLAIENMTKVPGTDRGFPADDYYTFYRLGSPGSAQFHDTNVMRLNNTGTGDLVVTEVNISDANDYTFELLDANGNTAQLPITIPSGSYADVDITFIATTGSGNNGIFVEDIEIVSSADNALNSTAVLHGGYAPQPEGGDEINAQEVFDAFGFQSSMLSIVNDEGSITPPNNLTYRPSSNFPIAANIEAGYEGDLILSDAFVQADPNQPVIGIQLSALHGSGSNGARFVEVEGTETVGGISFSHTGSNYQTLLPKNSSGVINFDTSNSISEPFRIAVANYLTTGGNNISGRRPDLLGARVYKVIDHNGNIVPNEYIVLQDFVQNGCGAGSANCDWNDNTFYFINIRPQAVPTAQPDQEYLANAGEAFSIDVASYFDKGYAGNELTVTATVNGGSLPAWMTYDAQAATVSGTAPIDAMGSVPVVLNAVDLNGLTASTTLTVAINEAPLAVGDDIETTQDTAILLEGLLANDTEPNGQAITIVTVDTPQNGEAVLQGDGLSVLYTPDDGYVGSDSFEYTIEDETGLSATATVSITVTPQNQAPVAMLQSSVQEGEAALYVEFVGSGSTDENPATLRYEWNFGDGTANSTDPDTSHTFTSVGVYTVVLTVIDDGNLIGTASTTITVSAPPNTGPTAVAAVTPLNGANSLSFNFDGSASNDLEGSLGYLWDFGDGNTATTAIVNHSYALAGVYDVSLTVTDEGDLVDAVTVQVEAKEAVVSDFALRINVGGPELVYQGETFVQDQGFVGGKVFENANALVPELYQTERSASPPVFDYNLPLENGTYEVTLHFAEIYWGATSGGSGGIGKRVFDVSLEGSTVLDDFDINLVSGPESPVVRTFEVVVQDGVLNMHFDAGGANGIDQPKLSGIEILSKDDALLPCALPDAWANNDIGSVQIAGETCFENGRYEVSASGADIWGSADEFHFVYRELTGDGEIVAQVMSLEATSVWAKAGVMMRNDLEANSVLAQMIISPNPNNLGGVGHSFQDRPLKGAAMGSANFTTPQSVPGGFPHYVRLVRLGNTFTGYVSETNGNWTLVGSKVLPMDQTIFVGLATTSHNDDELTTAVFENVSVQEETQENQAPYASIGTNVSTGTAPLVVSFDGNGSSDDKNIVSYSWNFGDGTANGSGALVEHTFTNAGSFDVTLTVADEEGEVGVDVVTIVVEAANEAPEAVATATPLNGEAPLEVSFTGSNSTDDDGAENLNFAWSFGNGDTSSLADPVYVYNTEGTYTVSLTVTDSEGLTDQETLTVVVAEPVVVGDFALRINAGGPQLTHNGEVYVADRDFVGGKSYTNTSAEVPELYKTERSALPPNFGYDIPLANGEYQVTLHFAEIFWGATGGRSGAVGKRVFDVVMEGNTILDDYDIFDEVGPQTVVTRTFDVTLVDGVLNLGFDANAPDGRNEPKLSAIEIVSVGAVNEGPVAFASATPLNGVAPLEVNFNGSGSIDDVEVLSYTWDFKDGGSSTQMNPVHTFVDPGAYEVSLTVADAQGKTDTHTVTIQVDEPVVNDFALRINAGGPEMTHNGQVFAADQYFVGGKAYTNASANVPQLYKTERSALPPVFAYDIPVPNGSYQVVLHFAEIFWGAQGGASGAVGRRVFDVEMEGAKILDDFDIIAESGSETIVIKSFNATIEDGQLNLVFDAEGSDGRNEPKLSAIEVIGSGAVLQFDPVAHAGDDIEIDLSANETSLVGSGHDPDGGAVSYQWSQVSGPDTAILTNSNTLELQAVFLVEGVYVLRLTVTDDEGRTAFDEVAVTVNNDAQEEVWLEAECGVLGSGWTVVEDSSRSGGNYVVPPAGFNSSSGSIGAAVLTYNVSVSEGTYAIFGLVRTPSGVNDSFWIRVNNGAWVRWNSIPASNEFVWHRVHLNEQLSKPRSFELIEGINKIEIGHREDGLGLDKLFLTKTGDLPSGLGGTASNCGGSGKTFEEQIIAGNLEVEAIADTQFYSEKVPNAVHLFPNPAVVQTKIRLDNPEVEIAQVRIYEASGRLIGVHQGEALKTGEDEYELNVSGLTNGVYFLRIAISDGEVFDRKLIVDHR